MPAPIMCGVAAISSAIFAAGTVVSSNSILASFRFQSTLIERTPGALLNESSTTFVQPGQCRPVTRYVAVVVFLLSVLAASSARLAAMKARTSGQAIKSFDISVIPLEKDGSKTQL